MTVDQVDNPDVNFTVPTTQAAGLRIPEFSFRQLIGWAIDQTRMSVGTPSDVVEQLFTFVSADVRKQFKNWLLNNRNIYLDVSWPIDADAVPMIVVEPQEEREDTDNTFLGDRVGVTSRGDAGDQVPSEAPAFGVPEIRTTHIYVATDDDRLTLLLYTLVKFIILYNKQALEKFYDVHNLVLSGSKLDHDPAKLPQFIYTRVLQAKYMTIFDYDGPASGPAVVNLILKVSEIVDGVEVDTTVLPPGE